MLTEFSVEGFRTFNNRITLNFNNVRDYKFNADCLYDGLINKAIIYGRNGVGKTNIIRALTDIQLTLLLNNMVVEDNSFINAYSTNGYAEFCYRFRFDEIEAEYMYRKSSLLQLKYERLTVNNNIAYSFDYDADAFDKLDLSIIECDGIDYNKFIQPNVIDTEHSKEVSFLGWIFAHSKIREDAVISKIVDFAGHIVMIGPVNNEKYYDQRIYDFVQSLENGEELKKIQAFFDFMGIEVNFVIDKDPEGKINLYSQFGDKKIRFSRIASSGAKLLLKLYVMIVSRIKSENAFIILDEFDAYYHYELAAKLVDFFKKNYPKNRILFTSHNTNLISNRLLRPDCYYILSSDQRLTALCDATERELREGHNLEKMYKSGEFDRYE